MKKRQNRVVIKNENGQATIEFGLTIIFVMALLLFFIQISLIFAWGNYIHYATFMSARAYLSGSFNQEDQSERARSVMVKMVKRGEGRAGLDRYPALATGVGGTPAGIRIGGGPQFSAGDLSSSWMQGVRYTFKSRLFLIPLQRGQEGNSSAANSLTLSSESWLGREPTYDECFQNVRSMVGIIDNGC